MAIDEKKILKEAKDAFEMLGGLDLTTDSQIKMMKKELEEQKLPLETIQTTITVIRKNGQVYRDHIKEAQAQLKDVKKLTSSDALAMAKKLDARIKSADESVGDFEKNLTLIDKVWDRCWAAEKSLRQSLEKGIESAETELKPMSKYVIGLPKSCEALQGECAKGRSNPGIKPSMEALITEVKACGASITTAQSVIAWIETVLKGRGAAYHPDVGRLADSADKLQVQLGKYIVMAKTAMGKALDEIKQARAVLAAPQPVNQASGRGAPSSSSAMQS